jgi:urease accessory protein
MTAAPATVSAPAMQRSRGTGRLDVKLSAGKTRIGRLHQSGNAKIRIPRTYGEALEAVLINTAGGITGGDTLDWALEAGRGTAAVLTTQACERIYRSTGETACQTNMIRVGERASLFWLPQETILFDGGRFRRTLDVALDETARFVGLESLVLGREAMGETVASGLFHDRWRIRGAGGELVHADDLRFDLRHGEDFADAASLGLNRAVATLVAVTPDDGETCALLLREARALLAGASAGASHIGGNGGGKIVVRLAAPSSYLLRRQLLPVIALFLQGRPLPKVWNL